MPDEKPLSGAVFAASGENGLRAFSRDGRAWSHVQLQREGLLLKKLCFLNGRCLAVGRTGDNWALSTSDGVKWDEVKLAGRPYVDRVELLFAEVTAQGERFAAVLASDGEIPALLSSPDGRSWSERTPMMKERQGLKHDAHLRRAVIGEGRLVVVGDYGAKLARAAGSPNLVAVEKPAARDTLIDVAFGNGVFVGGGMHGLRMRSRDGLTWTDRVVGEEGEHINSLIFDGRQFVGIGQGATYRSPDGQKWERKPNENAPTTAAFGDGVYVGSLWPGKLLRSTDAVRWESVHELPHHVLALAHGQLGKL